MQEDFKVWLNRIGLGDFAGVFVREGVDFDVVSAITESDLEKIGLGLGHRKRFLLAVAERNHRSAQPAAPIRPEPVVFERRPPPPGRSKAPEAQLDPDPEVNATDVSNVAKRRSDDATPRNVERRQAAVVFADLTGYTSLSAELDPEELQDVMAEFFRIADEAIEAHGGTVDKHLGDGVMAVFGAPISYGDDTVRAVRAAVDIHSGLQDARKRIGRDLTAHIGIASGEVLAGAGTNQYTVIGDAVNLASRLSDLAIANETYLSNEVHAEVSHETLCDQRANVVIKGLEEPVTVWKVVGRRDEPLERNALPFVGREAERAQFNSTVEAIPDRCAGAAFVFRGEPGIGKTRLATECLNFARALGFHAHHVLVLDFGGATGTDPLRALFKSFLGLDDDTTAETRKATAKDLIQEPGFEVDDKAFIDDLLGLPMSQEARAFYRAMENATRNRRKINLLCRVLERKASNQPQALLIEDLHWADQVTKDLCASLVGQSSNCPSVVMMTSRIESDPFDNAWRSGTGSTPIYTIDLRPLSARETQQLAAVAGVDQGEQLAAEIEKAGGNPLFLEMMIRSSADSQTEALSGNLRSMVQARIDRLDPLDRKAIQAASVAGQRFDLDLVQNLIEQPDYQPKGLLERSLVHPMGERFLFAHALVQESVYASITRRNAHELHRRAADWFDGRDSVLKAEHLARADDDAAPKAYLLAAHDLMASLRFETANTIIEKGMACAREPNDIYELSKLQGEIALQRGDFSRASDAFKSASKLSSDDEQVCRAYLGVAASNRDLSGSALAEAEEYLDKAKVLSERLRLPELYIRHQAMLSFIRYSQGDIHGCYESAQEALSHAEANEDPQLLLHALESFGAANYQVGRFASVRSVSERLLELARSQNDLSYQIKASYQLTIAYFYLNQFSQAIDISSLASQSGVKYGAIRQACLANEYLARIYLALGDLDNAREFAEASLQIAQNGQMRPRESLAFIKLAEIAMCEGQTAAAVEFADAAISCVEAQHLKPWALAVKARALQDGDEVHALLDHAESLLSPSGTVSHHHFHVRVAQMEVGLQQCNWDAVDRASDRLDKFTSSERLPWTDFHIMRGRAVAAWGRKQRDENYEEKLTRLRDVRDETGWKIWLPEDA